MRQPLRIGQIEITAERERGETAEWSPELLQGPHKVNHFSQMKCPQLLKGQVYSLYLNLILSFLCTFPLLEFDCSLCLPSVSSAAEEQGREIQMYAVAGAALCWP